MTTKPTERAKKLDHALCAAMDFVNGPGNERYFFRFAEVMDELHYIDPIAKALIGLADVAICQTPGFRPQCATDHMRALRKVAFALLEVSERQDG